MAVATIVLASINAFWLLAMPEQVPGRAGAMMLRHAVSLGMFLPALSSTVLALQSVFNLRFLIENYRLTEAALEHLRGQVMTLQDEMALASQGASDTQLRDLQHRFQKLVLRVEGALTDEYLRWRLIVQRDAHELG